MASTPKLLLSTVVNSATLETIVNCAEMGNSNEISNSDVTEHVTKVDSFKQFIV